MYYRNIDHIVSCINSEWTYIHINRAIPHGVEGQTDHTVKMLTNVEFQWTTTTCKIMTMTLMKKAYKHVQQYKAVFHSVNGNSLYCSLTLMQISPQKASQAGSLPFTWWLKHENEHIIKFSMTHSGFFQDIWSIWTLSVCFPCLKNHFLKSRFCLGCVRTLIFSHPKLNVCWGWSDMRNIVHFKIQHQKYPYHSVTYIMT